MNRTIAAIGLALPLALPAGSATAQEADGPYRLERTEGGYVRMDTRSGRMWLCREDAGALACRAASEADDPAAGRGALEARIAELEDRVEALERPVAGLPSDEEFERSLSFMERFMRRFMGIVRDMEEEPETRT